MLALHSKLLQTCDLLLRTLPEAYRSITADLRIGDDGSVVGSTIKFHMVV
jgi:hypothetical protein